MKLGGVTIDLGHPPTQAWIIFAVGTLIVCLGVAFSFIYRGSVAVQYMEADKAVQAAQSYQEYLK